MRVPQIDLTIEQVRCLRSGFRTDLVYAFRLYGPASIPEIAPKLGRDQDSLYYHVRQLVAAGLLRQVDTKKKTTRTEVIYDCVANKMRLKPKPWDDEYAALALELFRADFKLALEQCTHAVETRYNDPSLNESQYIRRMSVSLSTEKLGELKIKMADLDKWLNESNSPDTGQPIGILFSINPLPS